MRPATEPKSEKPPTETPGTSVDQSALRRGAIATIAMTPKADGTEQTQIELELQGNARGHALEAGMFFRVVTDGGKTFKGLIQVTEVVSTTHCLARVVGLTDRSRVMATGDQVSEVADLAALAAPEAMEGATRAQQLRLDQIDVADRRLFDAVRANYQQSLADLEARQASALAEKEARYQAQKLATEQDAAHTIARSDAEHQAAIVAIRSATTAAIEQALSQERKVNAERLAALTGERDQLHAQVDSLVALQKQSATRIESLISDNAERQRAHALQLRAEAETREVLQARLQEVEARQAGRPAPATTVLSAEPDRSETILGRLARVTSELEKERGDRLKLTAELEALSIKAAALRTESAQEAQSQAAEAQKRMTAAEHARDALELSRLEVERRYYDLSARILRLTATSPEMVGLQARLRESLTGQNQEVKP